jgi:hypothetical protein
LIIHGPAGKSGGAVFAQSLAAPVGLLCGLYARQSTFDSVNVSGAVYRDYAPFTGICGGLHDASSSV